MKRTITRRELLSLDLDLVLGLEGDDEAFERYQRTIGKLLPVMLFAAYAALNTFEAEKLAYLIPQPTSDEKILHCVTREQLKSSEYRPTLLPQWLICVMHDLKQDSLTVEVP